MPYIAQRDRARLDSDDDAPITQGELNYLITQLVDDYLGLAPNYGDINDVVGVLECAKMEVYRRVAAPYEDVKRSQNGDVFQATIAHVRPGSIHPHGG